MGSFDHRGRPFTGVWRFIVQSVRLIQLPSQPLQSPQDLVVKMASIAREQDKQDKIVRIGTL